MSRFDKTMGGSPVISCMGHEVLQRTRVRLRLLIDSKNLFIGQYDKLFEEYWLSPISYLSPYRG